MGIPVQIVRLSVIGAVIGGIVAFKTIAASKAEEQIEHFVTKMGIEKRNISYDVSVDLFGLDTHIEDIKLKSPDGKVAKIDEIVLKDFDSKHPTPQYLDIEVEGLELPATMLQIDPKLQQLFANYKKEYLKVNFALAYKLKPKKKKLDIEKLSYEIEDVAKISLEAELYNVASFNDLVQQVIILGPASLKFAQASVKYEDDGLADMLFAYNAKDAGVSVDQFKSSLIQKMDASLQKAKTKKDHLQVVLIEEIVTFTKNPKSFEVHIDPKEAVSFQELTIDHTTQDALKMLNISVDAN